MDLFLLFSYLVTFACGWLNVEVMLHFAPYCATHHTGNITRMAILLFQGDFLFLLGLIGVVVAFIIGSAISSFINPKGNFNFIERFGYGFIIGAVGLFVMALLFDDTYGLNIYCSLYAGYINGFITQFGLRASHMTGISSDAGLELGRYFREFTKKRPNMKFIRRAYAGAFALKALYIPVFVAGALLGVWIASFMPNLLVYSLLAIFCIAIAIYYIRSCPIIRRKREDDLESPKV